MSSTLNTPRDNSRQETDTLISHLRSWGVEYLTSIDSIPSILKDAISPLELIQRLAQQNANPRIRDASISLFLLHPELSHYILDAIQTSEPAVAEQVTTSVLAALYLQRMWSIRLTFAFGHLPNFPEQPFTYLWQNRHLPAPSCHYGELGLVALQAFEQKRTDLPFNFMSDWQNQLNHLLYQEEAHHSVLTVPTNQILEIGREDCQEAIGMSMRPNVGKSQIDDFLRNLSRAFRKQGRLYLVGGAALVHLGVRSGTTQDIDIEIRATNEDEMSEAIRRLKDSMRINVEFASPADFIPVPAQWETNAKYVGRYGSIDVFYFDFYSIALSKIERGSATDINDVKLLVQQGIIDLQELDNAYNEVLPRVGKRPYNRLDPQKFVEHYTAARQLL
jgi:hypothetical protein